MRTLLTIVIVLITSSRGKADGPPPYREYGPSWLDFDKEATDKIIETVLSSHEGVRTLSIRGEAVTDAVLPAILRCKLLHTLSIGDSKLTVEGLDRLKGLPRLLTLCISEAGFRRLPSLPDSVIELTLYHDRFMGNEAARRHQRPSASEEAASYRLPNR